MKKHSIAALAVMAALCATLSAQTSAEIEARLGAPTKSYAVSERVWMTPEFASDGQVCRMRFYPRRIAGNTNLLFKDLPTEEFISAIAQLIPEEVRGLRMDRPGDRVAVFGGPMRSSTSIYERVEITFDTSFNLDPDAFSKPGKYEFTLTGKASAENVTGNKSATLPDGISFGNNRIEMATVTWTARNCVGG